MHYCIIYHRFVVLVVLMEFSRLTLIVLGGGFLHHVTQNLEEKKVFMFAQPIYMLVCLRKLLFSPKSADVIT